MPDTEISTVGLNLEGNFADEAQKDAAAAEKLAGSLDKLREAAKKAQGLGGGVVKGFGGGLPDALKASANAKPPGGFVKLVGAVEALFGPKAAEGLVKGAGTIAEAAPLLSAVGPALVTGAAAIAAAAAALVAGASALIYAGVKLGISEATKNEVQGAILDAVTGGKGEGAMKVAQKIALDIGIDDDAAVAKVKKLANAKLNDAQIETAVKVSVGLDALEAGRGDSFVKVLEKVKNLGKFDERSMKEFAKEGINAEEVYVRLAKTMGISVDQVKAKIKTGTLDVNKGIDAVLGVADKKFGAVANTLGNSITGLVTKIQVAFKGLFGNDPKMLDPIKGVLKNALGVLTGPAGAAFGKAFGKLSDTLIKALFGPISGASGKKTMENLVDMVTGMVTKITAGVKAAAPAIKAVYAALSELFSTKKGSMGEDLRVMGRELFALGVAVKPVIAVVAKLAGGAAFALLGQGIRNAAAAARLYTNAVNGMVGTVKMIGQLASLVATGILRIPSMIGTAASGIVARLRAVVAGVIGVGRAIPAALGSGILSAMGAAISAAVKMALGVVAAVKGAIGMKSPPKAFTDIGAASAQAQGKGMNDNASAPARAGAKLAKAAAVAAAGGRSGAAAGAPGSGAGARTGGAGAGAAPVFNNVYHFAPGTTPAHAGALTAACAEEWKKQYRAFMREQQEGRSS
jgi:hypothetical protein